MSTGYQFKNNMASLKANEKASASSFAPDRETTPPSEFVFYRDIPQSTSDWTERHLDHLQITALQSRTFTPKEILSCVVNETVERRVQKVHKHLMKYMPAGLRAIDFDDFNAIQHDKCSSILYNANRHKMSSFKIESLADYAEQDWCESFRINGEQFCRQLIYMIWQKERGITISDEMFRQLFQHFTAMFGLHGIARPCLQPQTLTLERSDVSVCSTPDVIFYDLPNCEKENSKIFAICKVKRKMEPELEPSPPKRRHCDTEKRVDHLDTGVLGRHGGDLLVHYSSKSSKQQGLLGLIVQGTYVTFTHFSCNELDLEAIQRGDPSFPEGTGPVIRFSQPYNILKAEDRLHIIEPFLKLGFVQSTG